MLILVSCALFISLASCNLQTIKPNSGQWKVMERGPDIARMSTTVKVDVSKVNIRTEQ